MNRFDTMEELLLSGKYFKLVCGAGNEDLSEIKKLSALYTLAGAKGLDVSASPESVCAAKEGIDFAFKMATQIGVPLQIRPFIMVSVGMKGDPHVRKARVDPKICKKCGLCISACLSQAISDQLVINEARCIGCGNCSAICPVSGSIVYHNNKNDLEVLLPKCLEAGAEHVELHAAVAEDHQIFEEWNLINRICPHQHVSMCLDRLHLSNFHLEQRIKKAKEVTGDRLIIQADGYPMSGGEDDFNTTLQAVATADVINKTFNQRLDKLNKKLIYKEKPDVKILLSGGTNSLTGVLAKQNGVRFHGVSIGSFARKIIKDIIESSEFYDNKDLLRAGYLRARLLVIANVGEVCG